MCMNELEKLLEAKLKSRDQSGERLYANGGLLYSNYVTAKEKTPDILKEIKAREPKLTGHDVDHIDRVMRNAHKLLGDDVRQLNYAELYLLIMAILFHDAGNIFGRENHQNKISEIFDAVRGRDDSIRQEKNLVTQIVRAHCGKKDDGTAEDTLKKLKENHFDKQIVKLCDIAAVVRLADELDECPERASVFALKHNLLSTDSVIYHEYAKSTDIIIEYEAKRIVIRYHITINPNEKQFAGLLDFFFSRIVKIDYERQYTKYYSDLLSPFKKLEVTMNFWDNEGNNCIEDATIQFSLTDQPKNIFYLTT